MEAKNGGRFLDDRQSLAAIIAELPPRQRIEYESWGARTLESGFPNRRLVLYTLRGGQPSDISMLLMGDMEMTRIGGPIVTISDADGSMSVGVSPVRWREREVYFHVPQNFVFKWKGKPTQQGVQFAPHFAILMKTRSLEHHQVEGHTYCVTLNNFRERFPEVPLRY